MKFTFECQKQSLRSERIALPPGEGHTLTLFKTKIADFRTLFKAELRFLILCLRHLTRILILYKTIRILKLFLI